MYYFLYFKYFKENVLSYTAELGDMPQMGELNEMVFVDRSGGPPVLSSPSLNSPPEDRQPSMASPGGSHHLITQGILRWLMLTIDVASSQ